MLVDVVGVRWRYSEDGQVVVGMEWRGDGIIVQCWWWMWRGGVYGSVVGDGGGLRGRCWGSCCTVVVMVWVTGMAGNRNIGMRLKEQHIVIMWDDVKGVEYTVIQRCGDCNNFTFLIFLL